MSRSTLKAHALAGPAVLALLSSTGCGGGSHPPPSSPSGPVTPGVTITATPSGAATTAQNVIVAVAVADSSGSAAPPSGSVVISSGSYASFPASLTNGQAALTIPAGLLAVGSDTLTATYTPADTATANSASGSTSLAITASGAAPPVVTAAITTYATAGQPFRALPLSTGNVLVSITGNSTGIQVFTPSGSGLQSSCINTLGPSFLQDGASTLGITLLPDSNTLAAAIGIDGAIFYDVGALQTCAATGFQVSQGAVASHQGTFDIAVTPDGKYAFVANEYGVAPGATTEGNIGVVALQYDTFGDVITGSTLLGQISTGGSAIAGVTLSPDGARLYVASGVIGPSTTASGGTNPILASTACVQQTGMPLAANGILSVIDVAKAEANPSSAAIVATVDAGCTPVRIVETTNESTLWVAARGDDRVLAFSPGMLETDPGNALLGYADSGGTAPVGLQLFHNQTLLAVANSNRFNTGVANATVLDVSVPASAGVIQTLPTGLFPREITLGVDDATLYLTNYDSDTFAVITTTVK